MKKYYILSIATVLISFLWFGCTPEALSTHGIASNIDSSQLSINYVVSPTNEFKWIFTATTPVAGEVRFNFGNGSSGYSATNVDTAFIPIAGTYQVTLSFYSNGGMVTKHTTITTTKTDWAYFNTQQFTWLTGGITNLQGKNWVVDSLNPNGDMGVGSSLTTATNWWADSPDGKSGAGMYDDILNFNLTGLVCTYINHGVSYVNSGCTNEPGFTNAHTVPVLGDDDVNYTPGPGTFMINNVSGTYWLQLTSSTNTPIFPMYFSNPPNNPYEILSIDSDHLVLAWNEGNGDFWQMRLIRQGYVAPTVSGTMSNVATGTGNLQAITVKLANPSVATLVISSVEVVFGDGKDTIFQTNLTGASVTLNLNHRYMLAGTYTPTAIVTSSGGTTNLTGSTVIYTTNDPSYVAPKQDTNGWTIYNDFDDIQTVAMQYNNYGSGSMNGGIVANPNSNFGPNRSPNCYQVTKVGSQYGGNFMILPSGSYFDLRSYNTFTFLVYGTAGNTIGFALENSTAGYGTSTNQYIYTIQNTNVWEEVTVTLAGVGNVAAPTTDVTTNSTYDNGYYNQLEWQINDGTGTGTFSYYIDEITGPIVSGMK